MKSLLLIASSTTTLVLFFVAMMLRNESLVESDSQVALKLYQEATTLALYGLVILLIIIMSVIVSLWHNRYTTYLIR